MSYTIDEEVVRMRFDNEQFEKGISQSVNSIEKLKKSLTFNGLKNGINELSKTDLSSLGNSVTSIGTKFTAMEAVAFGALARIGSQAVQIGEKIVSALTLDPIKTGLDEYETKMNAIQVIKSNTRGKNTMEEITDALNELNTYADLTIYNFQQMTSNVGKFVAQGMDVYKATNAIKGLANLAGASGASAQDMSRATYQMSQALGGTIRKIDWNSLRNANMATTQLKDILKTVAEVEGKIDVDALMAKTGNFEESLSKGWLTGDLFTEAMNMYSDAYTEAELKAKGYTESQIAKFKAVAAEAKSATTEVKTLSQLWDVLKETAQSGWNQTWEYIMGSFEQVKATLTGFNNIFSDILNKSADARNAIFKEWNEMGGRDLLIRSLLNLFTSLSSILGTVKQAFNDVFPALTGKRLLDITNKIYNFTKKLKLGKEPLDNLHDGFKGIFDIIKLVKDIFGSIINFIIPPLDKTGSAIGRILSIFGKLGNKLSEISDKIRKSEKYQNFIYNIEISLLSILSIIKQLFSYLASLIDKGIESGKLVTISKNIAIFLYKVSECLPLILSKATSIFSIIKNGLSNIKNIFSINNFYSLIGKITQKLTELKFKIVDLLDQVPFISKVYVAVKTKLVSFAADIKMIVTGLWNFIKSLNATKIVVYAFIASFTYLIASVGLFFGRWGRVGNAVSGVLKTFQEMIQETSGVVTGFQKIEKSISEFFDRIFKPEEMSTAEEFVDYFMKIALSVAAVAAAMALLASQPTAQIDEALAAVIVMMAILTGLSLAFKKFEILSEDTAAAVKALFKMSLSVLVLAAALNKLSTIKTNGILDKSVALGFLLSIMSVWSGFLSAAKTKFEAGYHAMLWMSASVYILSMAFNTLDTSNTIKKIISLNYIMEYLTIYSAILASIKTKIFKGITVMLALSTSVYILSVAFSKLDTTNMLKKSLSLIGIMTYLTVYAALLSTFKSKAFKGNLVMLSLTTSVLMLSIAFNKMDVSNILKKLGVLIVICNGLFTYALILSQIEGKVNKAAAIMFALSLSMYMLSSSLKNINGEDLFKRSLVLVGVMLCLSAFASELGKIDNKCLTGAVILIVLSASILIVSLAINSINTDYLLERAVVLTVVVMYLSLISLALGNLSGDSIKGVGLLIAMGISLNIFASAFKNLNTEYILEKACVLLETIAILSVMSAAVSQFAGFILVGSLVLIPLATALLLFSSSFKMLDTDFMLNKAVVLLGTIVLLSGIAALIGAVPVTFGIGAAIILVLASAFFIFASSCATFVLAGAQLAVIIENLAKAFKEFEAVEKAGIFKLFDMAESIWYLGIVSALIPLDKFKEMSDSLLVCAVAIEKFGGIDFEKISTGLNSICNNGFLLYAASPGYAAGAACIGVMVPALLLYSAAMTIAAGSIAATMLIIGSEKAVDMAKVGLNCVKGFVTGIVGSIPETIDGVTEFFNSIIKTAESVLGIHSPSKVFAGIGGYCIAGLVNGLLEGAKNGVGAIIDICNSIMDAALSTFGIHSPSREFNYMGRMNVEGLVKGTEKNLTNAEAAGEAMAQSQIDGYEKIADEFNEKANSIYDSVNNHDEAMAKMNELVQEGTEESIRLAAALGTTWQQEGKITTQEMQKIQEKVNGLGNDELSSAFVNQWHQTFAIYKQGIKEAVNTKSNYSIGNYVADEIKDKIGTSDIVQTLQDTVEEAFNSMPTQTVSVGIDYEDMLYGHEAKHYANEYELKGISDSIKNIDTRLSLDKQEKYFIEEMKRRGYKKDSNGQWYKETHIKGLYETLAETSNPKIEDVDTSGLTSGLDDATSSAKSLNETLEESISIFEEFSDTTDLTTSKLLSNMESQINGMDTWATSLASLKGKIDDELYKELVDKGTGGYKEVNAILGMNQAQIDYMNRTYKKKTSEANMAAKLLNGEITVENKNLTKNKKTVLGSAASIEKLADGTEKYVETSESVNSANLKSKELLSKYSLEISKMGVESGLTTEQVIGMANEILKANPALESMGVTTEKVYESLMEMTNGMSEVKESIKKSVKDSIDIFKKWDDEYEMTSEQILENMHSQVQGITKWSGQLADLAARGIDSSLLAYLQSLGPQGAEYVNAFYNMTAEELADAGSTYAHAMELGDEVSDQLVDQYAETGYFLTEGFADGILNGKNASDNAVNMIGQSALDTLMTVLDEHSPSKQTYMIGEFFVEGFVDSLRDKAPSLLERVRTIGAEAIQGIKDTFNPTSIRETVNNLSNTLTSGLSKVSLAAAIANAGEETKKGFEDTYKGVSRIIDWDDLNPVIKPTLDISDVTNGFRQINELFNQQKSMSVNGSGSNGANQNGGNIVFNQYNSSPKSLNNSEIYRQTNNLVGNISRAGTTMTSFALAR